MILALFSYAVSTDVVVIYNVRFKNGYGCRICKGFAGSGCGLLHGSASECFSRHWKVTQNRQVLHLTSGRVGVGLRTKACSAKFAFFIVKTSYVTRVRVREWMSGQSNLVSIPGWRNGSKGSRCAKFRSFFFEMTELSPDGILLRNKCNSVVFLKRYTFVPPFRLLVSLFVRNTAFCLDAAHMDAYFECRPNFSFLCFETRCDWWYVVTEQTEVVWVTLRGSLSVFFVSRPLSVRLLG